MSARLVGADSTAKVHLELTGVAGQSVGAFEGGGTKDSNVYRPVVNCRMRGNSPPFCPVCYTELKTKMYQATGHSFHKC